MSVGLPLPAGRMEPDLLLPSMVELSKCFCIWSEMRDNVGTDMENESSSLAKESLLSVSRTKYISDDMKTVKFDDIYLETTRTLRTVSAKMRQTRSQWRNSYITGQSPGWRERGHNSASL